MRVVGSGELEGFGGVEQGCLKRIEVVDLLLDPSWRMVWCSYQVDENC